MTGCRHFHPFVAIIFLFLTALAACAQSTNRPAKWARPVSLPGIHNFYQVTTNLYRGAQPTAEGMAGLQGMGIKTVINLRALHSDTGKVTGTRLKSVRFGMRPWHGETTDVVAFLKVAMDTNNLPVFVHCQRGADRTGTMCAMYRIVVCGWSKEEAIDELKNGGYDFNPVWQTLIHYIEQVDINDIKRRVALPEKKTGWWHWF